MSGASVKAGDADLSIPAELPIASHADAIESALKTHQVVIVAGETGSGKTTQLPKICARAIAGEASVGITQPRRLAARGVASRLVAETGLGAGDGVALRMRFEDQGRRDAPFRVMTDGVLLNEVVRDRNLPGYRAIIVDEAHERSLNIDFLLGCLRTTLQRRPEFRLVVTSATINTAVLAKFFNDAPIIEVSGRGYAIDVHYAPPIADDALGKSVWDALQHPAVAAQTDKGDTLVFLPGEREIREARDYLQRRLRQRPAAARQEILPVYGRLGDREQKRIFSKGKVPRIVLATNIAETSLTIPGVTTVIDSGLVRVSRYSTRARVQRLETEYVSMASARQRAGRCGRVAPGVCIRLYEEAFLEAQPPFPDPEIIRTHLSSVVLRLLSSKLGPIDKFPWIDPPDQGQVNAAYQLLRELSAIDNSRQITTVGRKMARLPLDPRLARVVIEGHRLGVGALSCRLVAGLSVSDVRIVPSETRSAARKAHENFLVPGSDVRTQLGIYEAWQTMRRESPRREQADWYERNFLSPRRLYDWLDLESEIRRTAKSLKLALGNPPAKSDQALIKALLSGFVAQVAHLDEDQQFLSPHGMRFVPHPGSAAAVKPPPWVVATSYLRTRETYGLGLAAIEPRWILASGRHLIKQTLDGVRWDADRGYVVADFAHHLYDLLIAVDRGNRADQMQHVLIRPTFLRHALVFGEIRDIPVFVAHNARVLEEIQQLEGRLRRVLQPTADDLIAFYGERIPPQIQSMEQLNQWWLQADDDQQAAMSFDLARWVPAAEDESAASRETMPESVTLSGNEFSVRYNFAPGDVTDGATICVPALFADQITPHERDNAIPGLLLERVQRYLRALPKPDRRRLQPLASAALCLRDELIATHQPGTLAERLTGLLRAQHGIAVDGAWANFSEPRNLTLQIEKSTTTDAEVDAYPEADKPSRVIPEGGFPCADAFEVEGTLIDRWRALESAGTDGVRLAYFMDQESANMAQRSALRHLASLLTRPQFVVAAKSFRNARAVVLGFARFEWADSLADDLWLATICAAIPDQALDAISSEADFQELLHSTRGSLVDKFEAQISTLTTLAEHVIELMRICDSCAEKFPSEVADVRRQTSRLIFSGFVSQHGVASVKNLTRYLQAAIHRLEKLPRDTHRDTEAMAEICRLERLWDALPPPIQASQMLIFWQLQELRVSLFAQKVGVQGKVSPARLQRALAAIPASANLLR